MEDVRNAYSILVRKSKGKRLIGRYRRKYEGSIKLNVRESGYEVVDGIHLAQDMGEWWVVVYMKMNLRISEKRWGISYPAERLLCSLGVPWLLDFGLLPELLKNNRRGDKELENSGRCS
jgi:hypothetical protein